VSNILHSAILYSKGKHACLYFFNYSKVTYSNEGEVKMILETTKLLTVITSLGRIVISVLIRGDYCIEIGKLQV
jgi:hypothetical protein